MTINQICPFCQADLPLLSDEMPAKEKRIYFDFSLKFRNKEFLALKTLFIHVDTDILLKDKLLPADEVENIRQLGERILKISHK